ncbi:MAG: SDR family NAD(P)-dependent oxidoreductase [Peptococcaceae bacterium]
MIKIAGTKVIVTGGVSELGTSVCQVLGQAGASLAMVDNNEIKGAEICRELTAQGINCKFFKADITKASQVQEMVDAVLAGWGQVDVLVNSAGEAAKGFITDITEEQWDNMIDLNLKGTFLTCRSVLPHMIAKGCGKIVNIASVEGKQGFPLAGVHYSAAKGGIMALTRQLALQVSPLGIHVNCVAPGPTAQEFDSLARQETQEELLAKIPLGRPAKPEDAAYAVLFLASPMAEFLTGETIDINGGKYLA